ncbi:MAG: hypothetical protein ACXAEF_06445 [Candidatus Thorarchaeota archaeon]|jgi:uncharacterized protein (UPF0333 family)
MLKPSTISEYFIGYVVTLLDMVSRSLEKMLLIAIGLTTVVMVGVPVLLYAMDTLSSASELEMAQNFADRVHNATGQVDQGIVNSTNMQITVPQYVSVSTSGNTLTITYEKEGVDSILWSNTYTHPISVVPPPGFGLYTLYVNIQEGEVVLAFVPVTQ